MRVIACGSPYAKGGIGQHFAQLVEESRNEGVLARYYTPGIKPGDARIGIQISLQDFHRIRKYTPIRFSQSWTSHLKGEIFDRKVAGMLGDPAEAFMGFVGKTLHSFRSASSSGFKKLELIAANSHVNNLKKLHDRAKIETGINDGWLNEAQRRKTLKEYEMADVIYVHSEYVRESFVKEGIAADKLQRMYLAIDERFKPPAGKPDDGVFRVAYVGRVEASKGIPLLIKAFSTLSVEAELTLVGGWSTRAMRVYMEQQMRRDPRIRLAPGDPLPVLQRADVFVHPTYEDGFAYAPYEALACGVPVIVTEDTGMKEYVTEGANGYIVPTGDWQALRERMEHIASHPMKQTSSRHINATPVNQ